MVVNGVVEPGFGPVADAFASCFEAHGDVGAAVTVYHQGRPVVDLWGGCADAATGRPWESDTLVPVASTTKAVASVCALHLVERGLLSLDQPVATVWPAFGAAGKESVTVAMLLSHRAGVAAIDRVLSAGDVLGWDGIVEAIAAQPPNWPPGSDFGYHVLTYGFAVGEVVRRVTGLSLGRYLAEVIAGPLGLDLHIGLDEHDEARLASLVLPPSSGEAPPAWDALSKGMGGMTDLPLGLRAFGNPPGLVALSGTRAFRAAEVPSSNGMATARSLARLLAACLGPVDGARLLSPDLLDEAARPWAEGRDLVTGLPGAFGLGFQLPTPDNPWLGPGSFGHAGMGGSFVFAAPRLELAMAYAPNRLLTDLPDPRRACLLEAVLASPGGSGR